MSLSMEDFGLGLDFQLQNYQPWGILRPRALIFARDAVEVTQLLKLLTRTIIYINNKKQNSADRANYLWRSEEVKRDPD